MTSRPRNSKPDENAGKVRSLDSDEASLWHQVQRTVEPIDNKRQELKHWLDDMDLNSHASQAAQNSKKPSSSLSSLQKAFEEKSAPIQKLPLKPFERPARKYETAPYSPPTSKPAGSGSIDDRTAKKLLKGKVSIDGRIDLHGMTQAQAHSLLLQFLVQSHAAGDRMVMVITGKGRLREGILRNAVPNWLREPVFSNYVSAFRSAHITHGGEGALYVRLRRKEGRKG